MTTLAGSATAESTRAYSARFPGAAPGHFRDWRGIALSSIGIGTYLGDATDDVDTSYRESIVEAVKSGCNVIDLAVNYRFQRSERTAGEALRELAGLGYPRDGTFICTKGGFLPFDTQYPENPRAWIEENLVRPGIIQYSEVVAGCHCMSPSFLRCQLDWSLRNLGLETIDVYYIHNPETQLGEVHESRFYTRLEEAFETLEIEVSNGRIRNYGIATWDGLRCDNTSPDHLSLERVVASAREVAGDTHHMRFVQLPVNLAMAEAVLFANQLIEGRAHPLIEAARGFDVAVMASAPILQGRLARGLPAGVQEALSDLPTDALRAIQFARSVPGGMTALVGMSRKEHVAANLSLVGTPPLDAARFRALFDEL